MTIQTKQLDDELIFYPPEGEPLHALANEVSATYENDALEGIQLTFQVAPETYTRIDQAALFNLGKEFREPILGGAFDPDKPYQIRAALSLEQVAEIQDSGNSVDELAQKVLLVNSHPDGDPVFFTENWFALSVTQEADLPPELAETGKVYSGYSTTWRDKYIMTSDEPSTSSQPLFEILQDFYKTREWPYEPLEGQTTLHMGYTGENGEWDAFAHVNEENQQASFYSIYPVRTPAGRRMAMAELITRINYGMAIGNFEMDFDDGEVRYKTSLDVTDDRLSFALLTQMCEANLYLMDRYYPAVQAVMEKGAAPVDALNSIEG